MKTSINNKVLLINKPTISGDDLQFMNILSKIVLDLIPILVDLSIS